MGLVMLAVLIFLLSTYQSLQEYVPGRSSLLPAPLPG